jgi:hypothetical protein
MRNERMPTNHFRTRTLIAAAVLLAASLALQACGANSLLPAAPTLTPTKTIQPTQTATPTATATLPPEQWPLVFSDSFDTDSGAWQLGDVNDDYVKGSLAVVGGKLYVKLTAKKAVIWSIIPDMPDLGDVFVTLKVDHRLGTKTSEYGIFVRDSANSQYFFAVSAIEQGYEVLKFGADKWSIFTLWTYSSRILVGEPNLLAVKAEGPQFNFFINGAAVDDARDEDTAQGKAGIDIMLYKPGDTIEIAFDNFEVRSPETE